MFLGLLWWGTGCTAIASGRDAIDIITLLIFFLLSSSIIWYNAFIDDERSGVTGWMAS